MVLCPIWSYPRLSCSGYVRAGKPPLRTARRREDDRQPRHGCQVGGAGARPPANSAFPTREIVRTLRRGGVNASVERALSVKHVFYAGDEGGIVCDVTPRRDAKEVFVVSLTHLRIAPDHPLFAPILGYQRERVRRLALADP